MPIPNLAAPAATDLQSRFAEDSAIHARYLAAEEEIDALEAKGAPIPAELQARYDAALEEFRAVIDRAAASGVSKRSFDDAIKDAEDQLRREGVIGPDD